MTEATLSDLISNAKLACLPPDFTVSDAARIMLERRVGAVLVVEGNDPHRLAGIVTERDINYRVVATGRDPAATHLSSIMTHRPRGMAPTTRVTDALKMMARSGFRYLPVLAAERVVGIVCIADVFREAQRQLGRDMSLMESWIHGDLAEDRTILAH